MVVKSAWIFVDNTVQDRITHEKFGLYSALFSLGFLFITFADLGVNQYATKTLAPQQDRLKQLFPSLFGLKILLSLIYPFFMIGVGFLLGYRDSSLWYLFWLCLIHSGIQIVAFFRGNLQAFQRFGLDGVASVLDRAALLGIVLVLIFTDKISLDSYIFARVASSGLVLIVVYFGIVKLFGWMRPRFKWLDIKTVVVAAFPFAVMTILYSVNDKVDQVMLERLLPGDEGALQTGLYVGAYRWVDAVMMYLWTILPIFFARFALHVNNPEEQKKMLDLGQILAALPMIFLAIFVFFYGENLLFLFKGSSPDEIEVMKHCLSILFIAVLINGLFAIYSTLLTSTGHEKIVSWMIAGGIVLNVVLNAIFIPEYKAEAAAWNTVLSYAFLSVGYAIYITVKLPFGLPWANLGKLAIVGAGTAGTFLGMDYFLGPELWWLNSIVAGIVLLALSLLMGWLKYLKKGEA